jgi:predicted Rossmann-fold nucleotide-binding protein
MDVPEEFETLEKLDKHLARGLPLRGCVFQGLDLLARTAALLAAPLEGSVFLGCRLERKAAEHALASGALLFPTDPALPYGPYRSGLYTVEELLDLTNGYASSLDARIYAHFVETGGAEPWRLVDSLFRRLHDHAITDAVDELRRNRRVVAVMGGHALGRDTPVYETVAVLARELTRRGHLLVSGGGPGAMEATHLGAWLAGGTDDELAAALALLAPVPAHHPVDPWLRAAFRVRSRFPRRPLRDGALPESLAVPTWHYGHEPPNAFASHIAKYFANSEREEGLLTIAHQGVIFAPGSAGTIQEIFQDAAQNHYASAPAHASPMVFLGARYWTVEKPVFPLLERLARGHAYGALLVLTDDKDEIVRRIDGFAASSADPRQFT